MIDVMNFFQTMFMFKNTTTVNLVLAEKELAIALRAEALELVAIADREMRNGSTTRTLSLEARDQNKRRVFAEIAVWHHNRAAEKYNKAADRFDEAGRVYTKKIRAFRAKSQEMRECAAKAVAAVDALNNFLNQN